MGMKTTTFEACHWRVIGLDIILAIEDNLYINSTKNLSMHESLDRCRLFIFQRCACCHVQSESQKTRGSRNSRS
jgi:hypothetical protein